MRLTRRQVVAGVAGLAGLGAALPVRAHDGVHHVEIRSFAFSPATVRMKAGEVVEWTNHDTAPHTATGDDWDSGELGKGETATIMFSRPGRFAYVCAYHPNMTGEIIVE